MANIYLHTLANPILEMRPRPADKPYTLEMRDGSLMSPQMGLNDLQVHDVVGTKARLPISQDEQGYFFKRSWLPWATLHGYNPGGLRAACKALAQYPEAWQDHDCPLAPGAPFWRSLLLSEHSDRAIAAAIDKPWTRLTEDERHHFMAQAWIHHRPLLAEHLWQKGGRWPQDPQVLHQVMKAWVAPKVTAWADHLGVPRWSADRVNFHVDAKETAAEFPAFHQKTLDTLLGPQGVLPVWGQRLIEAQKQGEISLAMTFPLVLIYQQPDKSETRVEVPSSWAAYLLRFGMLAMEPDVSTTKVGATTALQIQQLGALGMDFTTAPPDDGRDGPPAASWSAYAQRHGAWSEEIEAALRDLSTPTPALPARNRLRS